MIHQGFKCVFVIFVLVLIFSGASLAEKTFPPVDKIIATVKAATLKSEKSFEDLLWVSPAKVAYVKGGVVIDESSVDANNAKWISADTFTLPITIKYLHLKKAGWNLMAGYVERRYAISIVSLADGNYSVIDSNPLSVSLYKGYQRSKNLPTYQDAYLKAKKLKKEPLHF